MMARESVRRCFLRDAIFDVNGAIILKPGSLVDNSNMSRPVVSDVLLVSGFARPMLSGGRWKEFVFLLRIAMCVEDVSPYALPVQ